MEHKIFYSLSTEDIETVLEQEFENKNLSPVQTQIVIELVNKNIQWYDIIHYALEEVLQSSEN